MTSGSPSRRNDSQPSDCQVCGRRSGAGPGYPVLSCPGCGYAATELATKAITLMALRDGRQSVACIACELVTMVIEPSMICQACQRPGLDVNDQLRARFVRLGPGDPADAPCVGCGYYVAKPDPPPLDLLVDCQACGDRMAISEASFRVGYGMQVRCGGCLFVTVIPKTVWCPKCGLHLRSRGIPELIRAANEKKNSASTTGRSNGHEIGILFDIDALGGGSYGQKAYRILFESLDPQQMKGCFEGDITTREPVVYAGDVDEAGALVVEANDVIRAGWTEGTMWKVVAPRRTWPWHRRSSRRR